MAKNKRQASDQHQQQNTGQGDMEGKNLPVPAEPKARTVPDNKRDITGVTDVNPDDVARNVPYEDSGDSEAGLLDDQV